MAGEIEAADQIAALRRSYAAMALGFIAVVHPRRREIVEGILEIQRGGTISLGRKDNTYYEGIDVWESIDATTDNPEFNRYVLATWFMIALSLIGDTAARGLLGPNA